MAKILDVEETLVKALEESGGKTIDIVLENEIPGITEDMYNWWRQNMGQTKYYKLWHKDHVSFEREATNDPNTPFYGRPTEALGKYGPSKMRFKGEPQSKYPLKPKYKNYGCSSHISSDGRVLSYLCSEYEFGPKGMKIKQTFRWPAKAPKDLVDALKQHVTEEVQNYPKFLPELYKKETGK